MSTKSQVFLIGPGFIGLEIIDELLENGCAVAALVRRESAATELQRKGVATILGTIDEHAIIVSAVARSDIVIHAATADHLPSVEAGTYIFLIGAEIPWCTETVGMCGGAQLLISDQCGLQGLVLAP